MAFDIIHRATVIDYRNPWRTLCCAVAATSLSPDARPPVIVRHRDTNPASSKISPFNLTHPLSFPLSDVDTNSKFSKSL